MRIVVPDPLSSSRVGVEGGRPRGFSPGRRNTGPIVGSIVASCACSDPTLERSTVATNSSRVRRASFDTDESVPDHRDEAT